MLIAMPIIGLLINMMCNNKQEKIISLTAIYTTAINLILIISMLIIWAINNFDKIVFEGPILYQSDKTIFAIGFYLDKVSFVYLLISAFLVLIVGVFSRFYMHREKGYKRFFNNLLFFYLGLNVILLSNNLETLFVGWEIIGVTSFFLISYYKDRYLPVKNALKVVSLYRLADAAILLSMWMCHHYFDFNIRFDTLSEIVANHPYDHTHLYYFIPFIFLLAAMVKSAQAPFSSWLPRAMEGPTTSSAIFYGSLSVHIGVFLMIRLFPIYEEQTIFRIIFALVGLVTAIITSMIGQVQGTVKTQIAYSSIAQIGLMFIEVALGWHSLALFHFSANAVLRCYQLLVSPSVLSYKIHDQFFNFTTPTHKVSNDFFGRLRQTFFILSIKEWNFDTFMYKYMWSPLKFVGNTINKISGNVLYFLIGLAYFAGLYIVYHKAIMPENLLEIMPEAFGLLGFFTACLAFVERGSAFRAWALILVNELFTSLSIGLNEQFDFSQVHIYLSGILVSGGIGFYCLYRLLKAKKPIHLNNFNGLSYEHPRLAFLFLLACLGLAGFPISPTFVGEDILIGHIHETQLVLTVLTGLNFILDGLIVYRIYARIFLGPHERGYHEVAYRSS